MKKTHKFALAFLAVASVASGLAIASDNNARRGQQNRLEKADADKSGDVTFEEFAAAMNGRVKDADANNDGKMTVAEIADAIQRMRAERMARRIVERLDANGDGELTVAEVEGRQKKMFALMDRNDDGKLTADEMKRRGGRHGDGRGWN